MKILLTGANGYIGTRLLPMLLEKGHEVYALIRSDKRLFVPKDFQKHVHVIEADLLDAESLKKIPEDIDAAYYLVHSMSTSADQFTSMEASSAENFRDRLSCTNARQIIYLSGIVNDDSLSHHLASRKNVETILRQGKVPVTTLMAGIIIGAGSASFEIIRDLVEKLPIMIAPKWTNNLTQPIAIRDVLDYLVLVLNHPDCIDKRFEVGGPDVLSYKELLLRFAEIRQLKRSIITVPVLTPKLSSYWLYFITSASFPLARSLVESLKNNAICKENAITKIFPLELLNFDAAVRRSFHCIEEDDVPSSWRDAIGNSHLDPDLSKYIQIPQYGTLSDVQIVRFKQPSEQVLAKIWSIGGINGWGYMGWAWKTRGFIDKLFGGAGLRRGRTHQKKLRDGDALDFWRVLVADSKNQRLLLYAEMKMPGEAWLEFKIEKDTLHQTATFRPQGLLGRLYWYMLFPFHYFIFRGMAQSLVKMEKSDILIRPMQQSDIPKIVSKYSFPWSTPDSTQKIWDTYFQEQQSGIRTVAIIEKDQDILGYGSFLRTSECASFVSRNIPEINAIWIHEAHRKQGLATRLIQWMEERAIEEGYPQIGIGVGLYADYGPAQKLYYRLGFIPDGEGITYSGLPTVFGQSYPLDDELIFWLVKKVDRS